MDSHKVEMLRKAKIANDKMVEGYNLMDAKMGDELYVIDTRNLINIEKGLVTMILDENIEGKVTRNVEVTVKDVYGNKTRYKYSAKSNNPIPMAHIGSSPIQLLTHILNCYLGK